ncbi:hypothetical protein A3N99_02910 [Mycobacteroides abscessus]|uniref:hypothetical protein n=1 Tax=Mycobacteroides abscessus TaxID=36809 RepID=UPI00078D36DB|nr:hypothetical protein [Mycobacteroides abscessus]AMU39256.1 hypothetical protein A3N99_02910 [Mycobacteroides abscessus]
MIRPWWWRRRIQRLNDEREQDAATRREAELTLEIVSALTAPVVERPRDLFAEDFKRAMRRKYGHA